MFVFVDKDSMKCLVEVVLVVDFGDFNGLNGIDY